MLQSYLMMPNSILYCLDSGLNTWQLHCMTCTMYKCYLALSTVFSTGDTGGVELSGSSISGIGKVSTWPRQKPRMSLMIIIFVKDGLHISESLNSFFDRTMFSSHEWMLDTSHGPNPPACEGSTAGGAGRAIAGPWAWTGCLVETQQTLVPWFLVIPGLVIIYIKWPCIKIYHSLGADNINNLLWVVKVERF